MADLNSKTNLSDNILQEVLPDGTTFDMILAEEGSFLMGSSDDEAKEWEKPVHEVSLQSFYIGKYPVTQELWKAVMGADTNPSRFKNDNRPVEQVSWIDTQSFIKKLNELTGRAYHLPTEAEWEYAARGGNRSEGYKYAGSNKLRDVGWYDRNSYGESKPVGLKYPNELGLYDMSGNVWEWVEDQWHDNYQGEPVDGSAWVDKGEGMHRVWEWVEDQWHDNYQSVPVDGSAWVDKGEGMHRVLRGGAWDHSPEDCRCSYRFLGNPQIRSSHAGFRLVLPLQSGG